MQSSSFVLPFLILATAAPEVAAARPLPLGISSSCDTVDSSRSIEIRCPSFETSRCSAQANGSSYYVVLVPNNSNGKFLDWQAGLISSCDELWQALLSENAYPQEVAAVYTSSSDHEDNLICDANGCMAKPSSCLAGWNGTLGVGSLAAASIPPGTKLLACAYLDIPASGPAAGFPPAPGSGVPSLSISSAFGQVLAGDDGAAFSLSAWVAY